MLHKTLSILFKTALAIMTASLLVASRWATANETVLHTFSPAGAEAFPYAGLIADSRRESLRHYLLWRRLQRWDGL